MDYAIFIEHFNSYTNNYNHIIFKIKKIHNIKRYIISFQTNTKFIYI